MGEIMKTILCIEDNPQMQILVEAALDSYRLLQAASLREAKEHLKGEAVDLIILDLELPDGDGMKSLIDALIWVILYMLPIGAVFVALALIVRAIWRRLRRVRSAPPA